MLIGTDILETIATLNNAGYLKGARQMAQATESLGNLNGWQKLARGSMIAGGALAATAGDALKQAAAFDLMQKRLETLYGKPAGDSIFNQLKTLTFTEPFKLETLTKGVSLLAAYGVKADSVLQVTKDLADASAAAFGSDPAHFQRGVLAYGEMQEGMASYRQIRMMIQDLGLPVPKYAEQYLHLTPEQVANIGKLHIPGSVLAAAVTLGIEHDPARHGAGGKSMNSLQGQITNVQDAWQILMASAGSPALQPAINGMRHLADAIKYLGSAASPKALGGALFIGAPALIIGGAALRGWQQITTAKNLAKIAQLGETAAEKDKLPVLAKEGDALAEGATKWGKFGKGIAGTVDWLAKFAGKSGVAEIATATLGRQALVGAARFGLIGIAIGGVIYDIGLLVRAYKALGDASGDWEKSIAATRAAQKMGYDVSSQQPTGFARLSHGQQLGAILMNRLHNPLGLPGIKDLVDTSDMGAGAAIDAGWAKRHKGKPGPANGILAQQRKAAAAAAGSDPYQKILNDYLKGEGAGGTSAGKAAKGWQLPKRYSEMVAADAAHVAALKAVHANQLQINTAKNKEIADMKTIAHLYADQAKLAKDANEKYRLLTLSDQWTAKAMNIKASETKKRSSFDKIIDTIISYQDSVQEPDAIAMGVNRHLFAQYSKGHPGIPKAQSQMLSGIAKRSLVVQVQIGNKTIEEITKRVSDQLIDQLVQMLSGSHLGSPLSIK